MKIYKTTRKEQIKKEINYCKQKLKSGEYTGLMSVNINLCKDCIKN